MQRIVFYGNCYAAVLEGVFSTSLAFPMGVTSSYVSCYDDDSKADSVRRLAEADVVVAQVFDAEQKIKFDSSKTAAKVVLFPTVSLSTLWPYGGVAHIWNVVMPYWQCGPYDYLMGDNYLNRKLNEGVPAEIAVKDYLNLDIGRVAHLDRLHEIVMDRQRTRDEKSGMDFADEIEAHFRTEHLFFNHYRPNARMAASLGRQVFARMGVPNSLVEDVVKRWKKTPFEKTMLPIHPGVAKHFGLSYGHADHRYLYHTGEMLTFEEFALRYASCKWNEPLMRGVATHHWPGNEVYRAFQGEVSAEQVQTARSQIETGLAQSDGSSIGQRAYAALLMRQDQTAEALEALRRAVRFDPTDADSHYSLAQLLEKMGRLADAEYAYKDAITQDPANAHAHIGLGRLLSSQGRVADAIAMLDAAVRIDARNGFVLFDLSMLHLQAGHRREAEASLRKAMVLLPTRVWPATRLAEMLIDDGRLDEAEGLLQSVSARPPEDEAAAAHRSELERRLQPIKEGRGLLERVRGATGGTGWLTENRGRRP